VLTFCNVVLQAQAAAKAGGAAVATISNAAPAGARPSKDFKGARDERKKKEKPV
jgi:hypothetical protein